MKRTCLQKDTNTHEQTTCDPDSNRDHPDQISLKVRPFDLKVIQYVKSFVRMKYSIAFILFFTIFLTACEDQHNENNPGTFCLGDTLQLTMKQTKEETLSGVTLTFDSVLTDSRCPTMVVCVWEGDASVQLLLDRETGKDTVILHTHGSAGMPSSDTVHGYCFHLIDLSPYPVYAEPIPQSEYVVKLIAEKQ